MHETPDQPHSATEIYAAPKSAPPPAVEQPAFDHYVVSSGKFWVLFLATCGLYQFYWFYRHWRAIRHATGENLWALPRTIFCIFFTHSLFTRFTGTAIIRQIATSRSLQSWATLYVILVVLERICSRASIKEIGSPYTDMVALAILPLAGWCLVKAQQVANAACGNPDGSANSRITAANVAWIIVGALVWLLVMIGLLETLGLISLE